MSRFFGFFLLFLFLSFISCGGDVFYSKNYNIKDYWNQNDEKVFDFIIEDTLGIFNAYFILRNDNTYAYRNLHLFTEISAENVEDKQDTLSYFLAKENGEWLGTGLGGLKENKLVLFEDLKFPRKGKYNIKVRHGMRDSLLEGIQDFSFLLKKENNDKAKEL